MNITIERTPKGMDSNKNAGNYFFLFSNDFDAISGAFLQYDSTGGDCTKKSSITEKAW